MSLPTPLSSGPRVWPKLKLVWGSADTIQGRWWAGLFCSYERRPGYPGTGLAISLRGLLRWMLVLGFVGYVAGAAVIARWFAHSPYNQIGFTDVLTWPVRREHVAQLRGRAWLAQGKEALKAKRWAEGAFLLRKGLDLSPEDFEARLLLAQFQLLSGQRPRALALLVEGASHGLPPLAWREQVFALAAAGEDWSSALLFCDRCLAQLPVATPTVERQTLLAHKLSALLALDRAAESLALAEADGEAAITAVKMVRARALMALRRAGEAAEFLGRWRASVRADLQTEIFQLQARALREAGRLDEMERVLADLRALHPTRPEPLAFAVEQRARAGRGAGAALDDFIFRFGNTPANLQLAVQPLAEIPDVPLVRRIVAAASERGYPSRSFLVQLAQAQLRAGDWPALARLVADLAPQFAKAEPEGRIWFDWIQCLSDALSSTNPSLADRLVAFLQNRPVSLEAHRLTAAALRRAGRDETARATLAVSRQLYAESPWLRAQQIEVERALAAVAAVPHAVSEPPAIAALPMDNWREFSSAVDDALARERWAETRKLLSAARLARPAPDWVLAHDAELTWHELRVAQALHDAPAFRLSLKLYVNGSAVRSAEVLKFARELHATGATDDALTLVRAVLEKSRDHPLATSLLAEWKPRKQP